MSCNTTDADLHSRVYTPPIIVAYRPLSFPVKCGGYVCWAPYTPAQLRSLSNVINFQVVIHI